MTTFTTQRTFAATPAHIFAAFADPARLARWWGPDGFRNTFTTFTLAKGGAWVFTMHGPDGKDYANTAEFLSIVPGRSIVIKHLSMPVFTLTITFTAQGDTTLVTWEQAFDSAELAAAIKHIVEPANEQNLNRWQAEVAAKA